MRLSRVRGFGLFVAGVLLLNALVVCAQRVLPVAANRPSAEDEEALRTRILLTLDYVESLVRNLPNERNRIEHLSRLGEVWSGINLDRSREHFKAALGLVRRLESTPPSGGAGAPEQVTETQSLRQALLRRVAAVDPELARGLIDEERERLLSAVRRFGQVGSSDARLAETLLEYAEILLDSDPQQSAALALQSLRNGVPGHLSSFLTNLRDRHPESAGAVFDAALRQATEGTVPNINALLALLEYLFHEGDADGLYALGSLAGGDAENATRVLTALGGALLNLQAGASPDSKAAPTPPVSPQEQQAAIQGHLDLFQRYTPEQVSALENLAQRLSQGLSASDARSKADPSGQSAGYGSSRRGSAYGNSSLRDQALLQAALKASRSGDWTQAQQYSDQVQEAETRGQAKELIGLEFAMHSLQIGELDRARQFGYALRDPAHRAEVFVSVAERLIQQGRREEALGWISEALEQAQVTPVSQRRTKILLTLLLVAADISEATALEAAQSVVSSLNHMESSPGPAPSISSGSAASVQGSKRALDRETIRRVSDSSLREDLDAAFHRLGRLNFDQTMLIVSQLQGPERRASIEISACRGGLQGLGGARRQTQREN